MTATERFIRHPLFDPHLLGLIRTFTSEAHQTQSLLKWSVALTPKGCKNDLLERVRQAFALVIPAVASLDAAMIAKAFPLLSNTQTCTNRVLTLSLRADSASELQTILTLYCPPNTPLHLFHNSDTLLKAISISATTIAPHNYRNAFSPLLKNCDAPKLRYMLKINQPYSREHYLRSIHEAAKSGNIRQLNILLSIKYNHLVLSPQEQSVAIQLARENQKNDCVSLLQDHFSPLVPMQIET